MGKDHYTAYYIAAGVIVTLVLLAIPALVDLLLGVRPLP